MVFLVEYYLGNWWCEIEIYYLDKDFIFLELKKISNDVENLVFRIRIEFVDIVFLKLSRLKVEKGDFFLRI